MAGSRLTDYIRTVPVKVPNEEPLTMPVYFRIFVYSPYLTEISTVTEPAADWPNAAGNTTIIRKPTPIFPNTDLESILTPVSPIGGSRGSSDTTADQSWIPAPVSFVNSITVVRHIDTQEIDLGNLLLALGRNLARQVDIGADEMSGRISALVKQDNVNYGCGSVSGIWAEIHVARKSAIASGCTIREISDVPGSIVEPRLALPVPPANAPSELPFVMHKKLLHESLEEGGCQVLEDLYQKANRCGRQIISFHEKLHDGREILGESICNALNVVFVNLCLKSGVNAPEEANINADSSMHGTEEGDQRDISSGRYKPEAIYSVAITDIMSAAASVLGDQHCVDIYNHCTKAISTSVQKSNLTAILRVPSIAIALPSATLTFLEGAHVLLSDFEYRLRNSFDRLKQEINGLRFNAAKKIKRLDLEYQAERAINDTSNARRKLATQQAIKLRDPSTIEIEKEMAGELRVNTSGAVGVSRQSGTSAKASPKKVRFDDLPTARPLDDTQNNATSQTKSSRHKIQLPENVE
ncbi:hypothetical protein HDU93_003640 [Gonapodya sp. JEL0774]|nr:hypothetical protein HDU93_003640 [Gonapodya sp. JEL0774]